jgi:pilus assembly protein CpaF
MHPDAAFVYETPFFQRPSLRPILPLMRDAEITEIMINGTRIYVERAGVISEHPPIVRSASVLEAMIESLLAGTGRTVNLRSPCVDLRLPDGSRVNVVIAPVAVDGAVITIRKLKRSLTTLEHLVQLGTVSDRMARFLLAAVQARLNILFSGSTGTGKTTTLGILSAYIPNGERIVTIEDTAELSLAQDHVVRLECRPPNLEGEGEITLRQLAKNAMRMRPGRLIIGEVRGAEAADLIQLMLTGHDGCQGVIHGGSPRDAITRLETMVVQSGLSVPIGIIHKQIYSAIDVVIQHAMLPDGSRKVNQITEVAGTEQDGVVLHDLYRFSEMGVDEAGRVRGHFSCTGREPEFMDKLRRRVRQLAPDLFAEGPC